MTAAMFSKPRAGKLSPAKNARRTEASAWKGSTKDIVEAANLVLNRRKSHPLPRP